LSGALILAVSNVLFGIVSYEQGQVAALAPIGFLMFCICYWIFMKVYSIIKPNSDGLSSRKNYIIESYSDELGNKFRKVNFINLFNASLRGFSYFLSVLFSTLTFKYANITGIN
jgi:hypothetical protein